MDWMRFVQKSYWSLYGSVPAAEWALRAIELGMSRRGNMHVLRWAYAQDHKARLLAEVRDAR